MARPWWRVFHVGCVQGMAFFGSWLSISFTEMHKIEHFDYSFRDLSTMNDLKYSLTKELYVCPGCSQQP